MSLSKESINLLRQTKRAILAEPKLYDQDRPALTGDTCNTPCCIFGWLSWICDPERYMDHGCSKMAELAGLSMDQFSRLYMAANGWPEPFSSKYMTARSKASRAKVAAARIEHFIETGGRE